EPWYSPSSSTPSASRGTLASSGVPSGSGIGAGRSVLTCPAATVMGLLLPRVLTWGAGNGWERPAGGPAGKREGRPRGRGRPSLPPIRKAQQAGIRCRPDRVLDDEG